MKRNCCVCCLSLFVCVVSGCGSNLKEADNPSNPVASPSVVVSDAPSPGPSSAVVNDTSSPSSSAKAAPNGLVYEAIYLYSQPFDEIPSRVSDSVPFKQSFYKYVFHEDGTCDCYQRVRRFWSGGSADSEGSWEQNLKNAPFTIKGDSLQVDWSQCQAGTPCAEGGGDTTPEILDIQSSGFLLARPQSNITYRLSKNDDIPDLPKLGSMTSE